MPVKSDPAYLKKNQMFQKCKKHTTHLFKFKNTSDVFVSRLNTSGEKMNWKLGQKKIFTMQYEEIKKQGGSKRKVKRD